MDPREGAADGVRIRGDEGGLVGVALRRAVGDKVGGEEGAALGDVLGLADWDEVGGKESRLGKAEGAAVGRDVEGCKGSEDGMIVGKGDGLETRLTVEICALVGEDCN